MLCVQLQVQHCDAQCARQTCYQEVGLGEIAFDAVIHVSGEGFTSVVRGMLGVSGCKRSLPCKQGDTGKEQVCMHAKVR